MESKDLLILKNLLEELQEDIDSSSFIQIERLKKIIEKRLKEKRRTNGRE